MKQLLTALMMALMTMVLAPANAAQFDQMSSFSSDLQTPLVCAEEKKEEEEEPECD